MVRHRSIQVVIGEHSYGDHPHVGHAWVLRSLCLYSAQLMLALSIARRQADVRIGMKKQTLMPMAGGGAAPAGARAEVECV